MEVTIKINLDSCIRCGRCVKVCPSLIFVQSEPKLAPQITTSTGCIACGHCTDACPSCSIDHSEFPLSATHAINYGQMPTPAQVMLLCSARRSNRAFSKTAVPTEMLEQILRAAHLAPTASNIQQVEFTLVTDPVLLGFITDFTLGVFDSVVKKLTNPFIKMVVKPFAGGLYKYVPHFNRLLAERAKGNDMILRGATAVIFIHTPAKNRFGCQDANLAYENGSLMAESLGVSQFYTGFVCSAIKQSQALNKKLGVDGTIHAGMALGIPQFRYPNYVDRKKLVVKRY
ncbi:MAG: nitroreductase family protein [Mucinivorans sp.]